MPTPGWVTPTHATASTVATAAAFNTHENDLLYAKDRMDNPPRARVNHSTTQSLTSGVDTALAMNSEAADSASMHDTATNNSRVTIPSGESGWYLITISIEFAANPTGQRKLSARFDGATELGYDAKDASASGVTRLAVSVLVALNAGQYVEALASQNSGGALNVSTGMLFSVQRVA
jgi:hypothetical protein